MAKVINSTGKIIKFKLDGRPGEKRQFFEVEPGETLDLPEQLVNGGLLATLAPGLVAAQGEGKADTAAPVAEKAPEPEPAAEPEAAPAPAKRRRGKKE